MYILQVYAIDTKSRQWTEPLIWQILPGVPICCSVIFNRYRFLLEAEEGIKKKEEDKKKEEGNKEKKKGNKENEESIKNFLNKNGLKYIPVSASWTI